MDLNNLKTFTSNYSLPTMTLFCPFRTHHEITQSKINPQHIKIVRGCIERSPEFPVLDHKSKYMTHISYQYYADGFPWDGGQTGWLARAVHFPCSLNS